MIRWPISAQNKLYHMLGPIKDDLLYLEASNVLKNGTTPASFHLLSSFQTHLIFYNKYVCEKMSIQYMVPGLNSQPLEPESPPITTRPGLPP